MKFILKDHEPICRLDLLSISEGVVIILNDITVGAFNSRTGELELYALPSDSTARKKLLDAGVKLQDGHIAFSYQTDKDKGDTP